MPLTLDDLRPNDGSHKESRRLGRGHGSGRGKTAGRGTKGQKARSRVRRGFEGGQLPIQKRMPYKRGFINRYKTRWEVVNVGALAMLETGDAITPESLLEAGLVRGAEFPVKVLADGALDRPLTIHAHAFSDAAKAQIEAAGGSAELIERTDRWVSASPRTRRLPLNKDLKEQRVGKVGGLDRAPVVAGQRSQE